MLLKSLLLKALLLSLLLHIAIFEIFGFSLSERKKIPRPSLMFLGSFLHPYDMETAKYIPAFSQKSFLVNDTPSVNIAAVSPKEKENSNQKLSYSSLASQKNKATLKSVKFSLQKEPQELSKEKPVRAESQHKYLILPNVDHY